MVLTPIEAASLRQSLGSRLRDAAKRRGVSVDSVRKQYIFAIFLAQLFSDPDCPWVLLGGNALLIRTGGGRFTKDVDLARQSPWQSPDDARAELTGLLSAGRGDSPFQFVVGEVVPHSVPDEDGYSGTTANVRVVALLSGTEFETFTLDLTERRHLDAPVDHVALMRVIEHPTLDNLPTVPTTPVENHVADKVCALYEIHGTGKPSTRYRDLPDIVRLVRNETFGAERLLLVLDREAGRRKMTLPTMIVSPHESWVTAFPRAARDFAEYPAELHSLEASLAAAAICLDELLSGERQTGSWDPGAQAWRD